MNEPPIRDISRREKLQRAAEREAGINEELIHKLVHAFYARVREDDLIGPVFAARITDWEPHLARMCDFWSSVMLLTGRYHGQPMPKHMALPIGAPHFDRWLKLFRETATDICPPTAARLFIERAERIGESLELGIGSARGIYLRRGERLGSP